MNPSNIILFPVAARAASSNPVLSVRTPETADRICATIRELGLPDHSAAVLAGVSSRELEQWRADDPEFARRMAAAREELQQELLSQIRQARNSDGSPNKAAREWVRKWERRK